MRKVILGLFVLLILSTNVGASGYLTPFNDSNVKITHYFTHSGGGVTLILSGSLSNPDGCQVTNRVHLKGNLIGHKNMISAALAAFASDKDIGLWSSGCEVIPFWGQGVQTPIIANLWVMN